MEKRYTTRLDFQVTPRDKTMLALLARKRGLSLSATIRSLIREAVTEAAKGAK